MSSASKGIPGVWKAITGKKGVETVKTELDQIKEFAVCCIDEFRDEEIRITEITSVCLSENKKLSYRRGTARCVVSIEILLIATQQCRNYLYDKS